MAVDLTALHAWLGEFARLVAANRQLLTDLDAAIGDADHGLNMDRALQVVAGAAADPDQSIAGYLKQTALTLVSTTGGASGPLYGTFFLRMASATGNAATLDAPALAAALRAGVDGVANRGKAEPGDKTMIDALAPAADAFERVVADGASLGAALDAASAAADMGRDATIHLLARRGRASYLGDRSIGHQDPGATSAALLITAAARTLA